MKHTSQELGDFTTTARVIPISLLAVVIGLLSTLVAWALLRLIGFFTNVFSTAEPAPCWYLPQKIIWAGLPCWFR
jgi:hypothetical protein